MRTPEEAARDAKVAALVDTLVGAAGAAMPGSSVHRRWAYALSLVRAADAAEWERWASVAGVSPPSQRTVAAVVRQIVALVEPPGVGPDPFDGIV